MIQNADYPWSLFYLFSFDITRRYAYKTGLGFGLHDFHIYLHRVRAIAFLSLFKNASWETR
jgi:hypothetical protein